MSIEVMNDCLTPDVNRVSASSVTPTSNGNGEFTLSQIAVFEQGFKDNITKTAVGNSLSRAVTKFPDFYKVLGDINSKFLKSEFVLGEIPKYEILALKDPMVITPVEFAQYISDYNYTPIAANFSANQNPPKFLRQLDDFYRGSFADSVMGGFCSTMPNIFGAIGAFFGLIGQIDGLIGDALSFIAKIRNIKDPLKALFDAIKVKALIEAIKAKVTKAVMGVVNKIKDAITNFDIANVVNQVESFVKNTVETKLADLKQGIEDFFSEENMEMIKNKLKGMIDYAVGLFDNPSIEEIMFLISRICGFAAGIETLIQGLKDPLDQTADRFIDGIEILKANSGLATAGAVSAGAIRMDDDTRRREIARAQEVSDAAGVFRVTDEQETFGRSYPSYEVYIKGSHPVVIPGSGSSRLRSGWNGLKDQTKRKLMILHQISGISGPFTLVSGYRTQEHQDKLYAAMLAKNGGVSDGSVAKVSQHTSGLALDLKWGSFTKFGVEADDVVDHARALGFNGIGRYNSFIHIDLRGTYTPWDKRSGTRPPDAVGPPPVVPTYPPAPDDDLYPDAKVLLDVYDGKYKDGDYVMFEGKSQRVNLIAEENADFEAQYSIGGN